MHFQADHAVGILFVAIGGIAVYLGFDYGFGDMSEMGPGALPVLLGTVLFLFGIALIIQTTLANAGSSGTSIMPREEVRPFLAVLAALLSFGLLIDHVGLRPGVLSLIGIGWLADKRSRLKELPFLVTAIVAIIIGIFYFGLGIPFHLVDWSV